MARPLRIVVPGGWYHLVNRGNRRERIFVSDDDRRRFLGLVAELPERFGVEIHAFVLMENHYHLLVRLGEPHLSRAIQWLQLSYSVRFNWANRTVGHVFQGRFRAVHLQNESDVGEVARYIHLNPVRIAGLGLSKEDQRRAKVADLPDPGAELVLRRLTALDAYAWSSWQVYGGMEPTPSWLETGVVWRANGGRSRKEWIAAMRDYTETPVRQGRLDNPWDRVVGGAVLGDADYAKGLLEAARANPEEQTEARSLKRQGRVSWDAIVEKAEKLRGVKWSEVLDRYGDWTRDAVIYVAVRNARYRLSEVLVRVPGLKYQAAAQGQKRIAARLGTDAECRTFVSKLAKQISTI